MNPIRGMSRALLYRGATQLSDSDLNQSAVVFAPHPDDETLGCGGTIARKRRADVPVHIVFMTDGSRSHRKFIDAQELKSMRRTEAIAASQVLGVDQLTFLDFENGKLHEFQTEACARVGEILRQVQPRAVFVPYQKEPPRDHWVTYSIVMDALKIQDQRVTVYEYPIWHWHSWPWTKRPAEGSERRKHTRTSRVAVKNILTGEFNTSVDIRSVRDIKQAALNEHRSQTIKLVDDPDWKRLSDVADGDFLACFFQDREVFRQHFV